jgi:hypothetical protein
VARPTGRRDRIHHAPAENCGPMAAEDEKLEVVPERVVEVRKTRTLFCLAAAADNDLGRSSSQIAIVAADTEGEARQIAFKQDGFGRDWRDPQFAVAEDMETSETRVFGDAIFCSETLAARRTRVRSAGDVEHAGFWFVFSP